MLATFAFDVCHDVYLAAREVIDSKIPTMNADAAGKYQWRPDRMPRLAEYVCDFARAGERALGGGPSDGKVTSRQAEACFTTKVKSRQAEAHPTGKVKGGQAEAFSTSKVKGRQAEACPTLFRASRMAMFRVYYLGGAEYQAARRHLGICERTWADWSEEIRRVVGRELTRAGVFPPSKYFREPAKKAS